ncbi:MAG: helix-turn-helix domain-containing protein [Eubacteriales bacterium]
METFLRSRVPWEAGPNLKEMTDEVGIDMDRFVEAIGAGKGDMEMSQEFGVGEKTVACLKEHFFRKGLGTTVGQD